MMTMVVSEIAVTTIFGCKYDHKKLGINCLHTGRPRMVKSTQILHSKMLSRDGITITMGSGACGKDFQPVIWVLFYHSGLVTVHLHAGSFEKNSKAMTAYLKKLGMNVMC